MKIITDKRIDDFVKNAATVAISGHIKPDGDCIGSVLALYNYLTVNCPEKRVDVYLEDPGSKYRILKGYDRVHFPGEDGKDPAPVQAYDVMITLDCSTLERLGDARKYFQAAGHTICLDHHVSNPGFADENYIYGDLSSASEVLYYFLDPGKLNQDMAVCLYTGIISDTGVFKYPATSPETMRVAANLMELGIPAEYLIDELFYGKTWNENRILGYAVNNSILTCDGKVIYSYITRRKMEEFHVTSRELEGIVPQLRLTRGVQCAVFLYETDQHQYKVSLRSIAPFDVNEVASAFGGGGHVRAAGCNITGELKTCIEAILLEVSRHLN